MIFLFTVIAIAFLLALSSVVLAARDARRSHLSRRRAHVPERAESEAPVAAGNAHIELTALAADLRRLLGDLDQRLNRLEEREVVVHHSTHETEDAAATVTNIESRRRA
jgi:hypothetical protein